MEQSMQELIRKLRGSSQQAALTGNSQNAGELDKNAITSFYDSTYKNRNANRALNQDIINSNRTYDLAVKSQADSADYNRAALAQSGARDLYTQQQNKDNEKFQWMGAGTAALGAVSNLYAGYEGNQQTQRMIDMMQKQNALPENNARPLAQLNFDPNRADTNGLNIYNQRAGTLPYQSTYSDVSTTPSTFTGTGGTTYGSPDYYKYGGTDIEQPSWSIASVWNGLLSLVGL